MMHRRSNPPARPAAAASSAAMVVFAALLFSLGTGVGGIALAQDEPYDYATWRQFWSFKPVTKPAVPAVENKSWVRNPIDAFILARLEARGIQPAPEADKHTLIRRATFDLTGLPPTLAEIQAFINDPAPDAYEKLIRRLLDSPHYGERHGRHWLDVVRYEQGKVKLPGVKNTRGELDFRDYIIRSFNNDKPYDQLLTEHLAGDLLPAPADREQYFNQLTATAFLSIGNWFDECTDPNRLKLDIIDEQINAVSKAFMGLTVSCARCHDHKFDPITEKDYYALAGVFASTRIIDTFNENWKDGRVRLTREKAMPAELEAFNQQRQAITALRAEKWEKLQALHSEAIKAWKEQEPAYRAAAKQFGPPVVIHKEAHDFTGQLNLKITELMHEGKKVTVLEPQSPGEQWVRYEITSPVEGEFRFDMVAAWDGPVPLTLRVNGQQVEPIARALELHGEGFAWDRRSRIHVANQLMLRQGKNEIRIFNKSKDTTFPRIESLRFHRLEKAAYDKLNEVSQEQELNQMLLWDFALSPDAPYPSVADILPYSHFAVWQSINRQYTDRIESMLAKLQRHDRIVAATDHDAPTNLPIHIGGDTYRVSKSTVPRALPVLFEHAVKPPAIPATQSGRLELARWLTDPNHPLTARVMVNRLWQYHFGTGIVDTANDFGSRGSAPTHPELLDWLAATFIEQDWSMKKMHYLIMTSATYRQAGTKQEGRHEGTEARRHEGERKEREEREEQKEQKERKDTRAAPPAKGTAAAVGTTPPPPHPIPFPAADTRNATTDVRLFSPFPRRRLEVEAIYDAMLATTGKVVRQGAGQPLDFNRSADRMIYVLTSNRSPTGLGGEIRKMFAVFDYDPTGEPIGKRDSSTTAAQSLFWLNNPIPQHFAGEFAKQLLALDKLTDEQRIDRAYLMAIGTKPAPATVTTLMDYLKTCEKQGVSREESWKQVCMALYASSAFRYLE